MTEYQRWALAFLAIIAAELGVLIVLKFVRRDPRQSSCVAVTVREEADPTSIIGMMKEEKPTAHRDWLNRVKKDLGREE